MKTINPTETPTTFFLPADDLRAAFQCISTDSTRYYLNGVFIDASARKLVAIDGHQMLTIDMPDHAHIGAECLTEEKGFILSCDAADKAFKAKSNYGDLWVYGDVTTGILQFVAKHDKYPDDPSCARLGVLEFDRVDGTFPDWTRVVAKGDGRTGTICYSPTVLAKLVKAADVIDKGKAIRLTSGEGADDPIRVDFAASARLRGTLMPVRWKGWA